MRFLRPLLVLLPALLFWGCPYESAVPVDEPNIPVDPGLFGKWKQTEEEKSYASVSKYSDQVYRLVYNSWTTEHRSYDVRSFKAHLSVLSGVVFLNVQPDMKTGGSYYLCTISVNAGQDTLRIRPVSEENKKKFTNSEELRKWLMKKMSKNSFFEKEEVFTRVP